MLAAGVPLQIVANRLGHASVRVTCDVYSHVVAGLDERASETVSKSVSATPRQRRLRCALTSTKTCRAGGTLDPQAELLHERGVALSPAETHHRSGSPERCRWKSVQPHDATNFLVRFLVACSVKLESSSCPPTPAPVPGVTCWKGGPPSRQLDGECEQPFVGPVVVEPLGCGEALAFIEIEGRHVRVVLRLVERELCAEAIQRIVNHGLLSGEHGFSLGESFPTGNRRDGRSGQCDGRARHCSCHCVYDRLSHGAYDGSNDGVRHDLGYRPGR